MQIPFSGVTGLLVQALPFLPRGKGATILLLGGLAVLCSSLLWSLARPRGRPSAGSSGRWGNAGLAAIRSLPSPTRLGSPSGDAKQQPRWLRAVMSDASRQGMAGIRLVQAGRNHAVLRPLACASCRLGSRPMHGCERERSILDRLLAAHARGGRVVEVACSATGRTPCSFELRAGDG